MTQTTGTSPGRETSRHRATRAGALTVLVTLAALAVSAWSPLPARSPGAQGHQGDPAPPLSHQGRWFTDATGRVVMLRGVNFVEKWAPFTPEATGFNDDDATLLSASGFNTVRLGVVFEFLMPQPGHIDRKYLASIARTVGILSRHRLQVLLDFHQDGWGPVTHGNGMPAWATLTDGLPNPPASFPLYYIQNPALQRAFDNFWANRRGPDGVALQSHYAAAMRAVAARFAARPNVLGYEAMNEPWPGTNWSVCTTGCPNLEHQLLAPFYTRMTAEVRAVDRHHPVFVEPFTLFNFGGADTSLPGADSTNALSTHVYASNQSANASVMDHSVAAAERNHTALLVTEWGATNDPATLDHTENQFDARLVPWLYWSYNGHVVTNSNRPLVPGNLNVTVLDALTRPYPIIVNGTPTRLAFDTTTSTLDLTFATRRPGGHRAPRDLDTVVTVPKRRYPDGYTATAVGGEVTSRPCVPTLTVRNQPHAAVVSVRVTPSHCP